MKINITDEQKKWVMWIVGVIFVLYLYAKSTGVLPE